MIWFKDLSREDVPLVGGRNASPGEMVAKLAGAGIRVPAGLATSADMFRDYLAANHLHESIAETHARLDAGKVTLADAGQSIRATIQAANWPEESRQTILGADRELARRTGIAEPAVAVPSSATTGDLPDASFAGQQETFLNILGEAALLDACRRCYASLYTDRAITYRRLKGFEHSKVALSVGVQQMVSSDIGGAGVMFSIDTESGFDKVVLINAAWGLGETMVQGTVSPDEHEVHVKCEVPSNVILAGEFAMRFDGFSIGANDLTQITLGVDSDAGDLAALIDERDPAAGWMIETVIARAHEAGRKVGLCGQAPSKDPAFARRLVEAGIDSVPVMPDSVLAVKAHVAAAERGDRVRRSGQAGGAPPGIERGPPSPPSSGPVRGPARTGGRPENFSRRAVAPC